MANEKRLIDKKSAWKTAQRIYSDPVLLHAIKNTLDTTPTVDAVEVAHGWWIELPSMEPDYKCSECGRSYAWWEPSEAHYCPNCGAKMDGDGNG
jgi:hypothetical protein